MTGFDDVDSRCRVTITRLGPAAGSLTSGCTSRRPKGGICCVGPVRATTVLPRRGCHRTGEQPRWFCMRHQLLPSLLLLPSFKCTHPEDVRRGPAAAPDPTWAADRILSGSKLSCVLLGDIVSCQLCAFLRVRWNAISVSGQSSLSMRQRARRPGGSALPAAPLLSLRCSVQCPAATHAVWAERG